MNLSAALEAYARLESEYRCARSDARRSRRALVIASVIAGVLAVALWAALMLRF